MSKSSQLESTRAHAVQAPAPRVLRIGSKARLALEASISAALAICLWLPADVAMAGDILRAGAPAPTNAARAGSANPGAASAAPAGSNARDAMARTAKAISAVQSMQAAARLQAQRNAGAALNYGGRVLPPVANGLRPGGLQVAPGVPVNLAKPTAGENRLLWQGAQLPKQAQRGGDVQVTVKQTESRASLTWETFNVGEHTSVVFDQSAGGQNASRWVVFNKIDDPSGVPSQILGSIQAPGQVYLINRNGLIFGGKSVVNTRGFVASSLPINENLIQRGLLNNPDAQFLFSAYPVAAGSEGTPAFNPSIRDRAFSVSETSATYTLHEPLAVSRAGTPVADPSFTFVGSGGLNTALVSGTDYSLAVDGTSKKATVTFTTAGLAKLNGSAVTVSYTPRVVKTGDVVVQPGATLRTPQSNDGNGGRVMLVGTNVVNAGTISTPSGQTIIAAGQQVGIAAHASSDPSLRGLDVFVGAADANSGKATNAGMIESLTGSVLLTGRAVNQFGAIQSTSGVNLNGRIDLLASYGAVANPLYNEQSDVLRTPFVYQSTGVVTFGPNSATQILPEYGSTQTAPGTTLPEVSQINVRGLAVNFRESSLLLAPNGNVTIGAGTWGYRDVDGDRTTQTTDSTGKLVDEPRLRSFLSGSTQNFLYSAGQVYVGSGALISVAGSTDVFVPIADSILSVQFRGAELADSPFQRDGTLRGVDLTVDLRRTGIMNGRYWQGTPLGDVTGLAGLVQRNAAQLTTSGGTLTLQAGDSIAVQPGATLDVSGGYFRNGGGMVKTTRLMQSGHLVDIADAVPNQRYDGIYTGEFTEGVAKYGVSRTYTNPFVTGSHFEPEYVQGAPGGTLNLTAPSMALDGELRGRTVQDPRGRSVAPYSHLSLAFNGQRLFELSPTATQVSFIQTSPTPPSITFAQTSTLSAVGEFRLAESGVPESLPAERVAQVILSPSLLDKQGFGYFSVDNSAGDISVRNGIALSAPPQGSVTLTGKNVSILGEVTSAGGSLTFTAFNYSPSAAAERSAAGITNSTVAPPPLAGAGIFTLANSGRLSTAGLIVDDRLGTDRLLELPLAIDGGSISISAYSAKLESGSLVDVSGGVNISPKGVAKYGKGGSISILAGKNPDGANVGPVLGGELILNGALAGYSGAQGGSLTLQAMAIQIGGAASTSPQVLSLAPSFFQRGGFTSYNLTGIGLPSDVPAATGEPEDFIPGVYIAPGTHIAPVAESLMAITQGPGAERAILQPILKAEGQRSPVSLSFTAAGSDDGFTRNVIEVRGDLVMGRGASISVDAGASVSFKGQTVSLEGSVIAPGGAISIVSSSGAFPFGEQDLNKATFARTTVFLGSNAFLSTAGKMVEMPDAFGRRTGTLLPGGSITVQGNIVAEAGSVLDVSGSTAVFDLPPAVAGAVNSPTVPLSSGLTSPLWSLATVPTVRDSSGGSIMLAGTQMLYSDASLYGHAGGATAVGGTLAVQSGRFYVVGANAKGSDVNLVVVQKGQALSSANGGAGVGHAVYNAKGAVISGAGFFSAQKFAAGGFENFDLGYNLQAGSPPIGGNVQFSGPVSLLVPGQLRLAGGGIIQANAAVNLTAGRFVTGQSFLVPFGPGETAPAPFQQVEQPNALLVAPTFGTGNLTVRAGQIDIGTVSLLTIGRASFIADSGDIRGNGTLDIAGDLTLRAAQVYPTTLSTFSLFAYDHGGKLGSISIVGSGTSPTPLSAGGTLNIFASKISQGGTLRAPMGTITLGWDGTDFDPSDADLDSPFDPIARGTVAVPTSLQVAVAKQVLLRAGSMTSVSAIDSTTGLALQIPFGLSPDGFSWIDPRGVNVTTNGLPVKQVIIGGNSVVKQAGSTIDLRGGGDLYAFRWVPGTGGGTDLLGTTSATWSAGNEYRAGDLVSFNGKTYSARVRNTGQQPAPSLYWSEVAPSFAILPSYNLPLAPYAPFNPGAASLSGDPGYVSSTLQAGDQITLDASPGLAAGTYTLLPARYALLPGAFLITPTGKTTIGTISLAIGSSFVSGITSNRFGAPASVSPVRSQYEVVPFETLRERAAYNDYLGNFFFSEASSRLQVSDPQLLPMDAGYLGLQGDNSLRLAGSVLSSGALFGRSAAIDVSSFADIYVVGGKGTAPAGATAVVQSSVLSSWNAGSLVIGGFRRESSRGTTIEVRTNNLVVDNAGSSLAGADITLTAKGALTLKAGSSLTATGSAPGAGDAYQIKGGGALVRVSSDASASVLRSGAVDASTPTLTVEGGSSLAGASVNLDSTYATKLDPNARLSADLLTLGSGQISVLLDAQTGPLAGSVVDSHLVLQGTVLEQLQQSGQLVLNSYRTIDFYGSGAFGSSSLNVTLQASGLRGFGQGTETATINAGTLKFSNAGAVTALSAPTESTGSIEFNAGRVLLGKNTFTISGYTDANLKAAGGLLGTSTGQLAMTGNMTVTTPLIAGERRSQQTLSATGDLTLARSAGAVQIAPGLGANFTFTGRNVIAATDILLPSGQIMLHATTGNVTVRGDLSVAGTSKTFFDLVRYSPAGSVVLTADAGNVTLEDGSHISVAGAEGGGQAGFLNVNAGQGIFDIQEGAVLRATAATGYASGSFSLDAGSLSSFAELSESLNSAGFFQQRHLRVRTGDVVIDGTRHVRDFALSTDAGNITVTGAIDSSGQTGGSISLVSGGNLTLADGALLTVHAEQFNHAGKGGSINLEAGAALNGVANLNAMLTLGAGATIDLGVDAFRAGDYLTPGSSAFDGQFTGTLHLRAPRSGNDVLINPVMSQIKGASSVLVEAYRIYDRTATGTLDNALRTQMNSDNTAFIAASYGAIDAKMLQGGLDSNALVIAPGVEIINRNGDLTLGTTTTTTTADWDLSGFRYGPKNAPGILTLRASGNLVFNNTLSDGFTPVANTAANGNSTMWLAPLKALDPNLPLNTQSWSYRLSAGSDLTAADYHAVNGGAGSIFVGEFYPLIPNTGTTGTNAAIGATGLTANTIRISSNNGTRYEVIRTGAGDIDLVAGGDVQLRNQFATIYTAGVALPDPTRIYAAGDFVTPILNPSPAPTPLNGAYQQPYEAQWSIAGGNVTINAVGSVGRYTRVTDANGTSIVPDSTAQLPNNWLYRRSFVDPASGLFGAAGTFDESITYVKDPAASTTWWIDYSNFFQGVGALGGGNVAITAGQDVINLDAVAPTTARMPGVDPVTGLNVAPDAAKIHELGGGDVAVRANGDISGGVYYVERGQGSLFAGGAITTNSSRSPSKGAFAASNNPATVVQSVNPEIFDPLTWLPTTLFLGKGGFDVSARGDVLIGPVANTFWLPQGQNNRFWYKTYFNTYAADSAVDVSSFGGSVTNRLAVVVPGSTQPVPTLIAWMERENLYVTNGSNSRVSHWRPWLRLAEAAVAPFGGVASVLPPTLRTTAFAGDINLAGAVTLYPSQTGTLELAASGGIIGLQPVGRALQSTTPVLVWTASKINVSDATPSFGITSPLSYQNLVGAVPRTMQTTAIDTFDAINALFAETGSYTGEAAGIDFQQTVHAPGPLHRGDASPVKLYASNGDITGLTLFSPKVAQVTASRDISDVSLYIQNLDVADISRVTAGRDVIPFNETSALRTIASDLSLGNFVGDNGKSTVNGGSVAAAQGDLQISGPGVLEVLAGRNVDLGFGPNFADGTGAGITSIGNARNPALPQDGADLIVMTGVGGPGGAGAASGLSQSSLNFAAFMSKYADDLASFDSAYLTKLGAGNFATLTEEQKAIVSLELFYSLLRDAGRSATAAPADPTAPAATPSAGGADSASTGGVANDAGYDAGFTAIKTLFGASKPAGDLFTRSRDIRTRTGGAISIAAPGGGITMASEISGSPLTPPGIVTESGGTVATFTDGSVDIGQARIFTLRGGDIIMWASNGDIAAGNAPKTVVTAPPTRVLLDVTTGDVQTDLGGLATGGGIGRLTLVQGVAPGSVDLIAPNGTVDAGDAGIRATGTLNIAAAVVLNADNISSTGTATGVPAPVSISAPAISAPAPPPPPSTSSTKPEDEENKRKRAQQSETVEAESIFTVEVIGYGGAS